MNDLSNSQHLAELGIPRFLWADDLENVAAEKPQKKLVDVDSPNVATSNTSAAKKTKCLVVETKNNLSFCVAGRSQNLLLKMLSAIDLSADDVLFKQLEGADITTLLTEVDAETVLLMSSILKPAQKTHFATHHPSEVMKDHSLKREVWEVLKQLQAVLS